MGRERSFRRRLYTTMDNGPRAVIFSIIIISVSGEGRFRVPENSEDNTQITAH